MVFLVAESKAGSHLPVLLSEKLSPIYTQMCFSLLLRCHPISEDSPAGLLMVVYPFQLLAFFLQPEHPNLSPPKRTQAPGGQLLFSYSVTSDSLQPHGLQLARLPCPLLISWSLLKLMSIESVMPSNYPILCHSPLLLPSVFPSIRAISNESVL